MSLKVQEARQILNISEGDTIDMIKKKYREQALRWHPDKNNAPNATEEFQKIQSAYQLLSNTEDGTFIKESYRTMLFNFLNENLPGGNENLVYVLEIFVNKLKRICEKNALIFFENMNLGLFSKIYAILVTYKELFYLSDEFIIELDNVLNIKKEAAIMAEKSSEVIIIHPTIDDLFENNLYKLNHRGHTFLVPLWHHELIYDMSGLDLCIQCIPILPDRIQIDENNNIEIEVEWNIREIWDKTNIFIYIGTNTFYILRESLIMKEYQTIRLHKNGISNINTNDIYDISKKSDIIIRIHLVL
jgi:hypothetical protein